MDSPVRYSFVQCVGTLGLGKICMVLFGLRSLCFCCKGCSQNMHGTCVAIGHRCLQELSNHWRGAVNSSVDTLDKVYWITQLRNSVALIRLSHLFAKFSFCVHIISDFFLQKPIVWQSIWESMLHWLPLITNVPVMVILHPACKMSLFVLEVSLPYDSCVDTCTKIHCFGSGAVYRYVPGS